MKTLLRRLLGPSKRELRAKLDTANALAESRRVKAEEGDRLLCREIDNLNNELDGLSHQFAPIKFENDRLVGENATLKAHLESGQRYNKLLADEKERLRLDAVELRETIERLGDDLNAVNALLCDRNGRCKQSNEVIEGLIAERDRLTRMLAEPEFLKAEARWEGERRIADATMKHWASKMMVMSFADSLGTAENCVELEIGDDEFGRFLVTVQWRPGKSPLELLDEMRDRLRTMEIALESSAELERKWKRQRRQLRKDLDWHVAENAELHRMGADANRRADDLYAALSDLFAAHTGKLALLKDHSTNPEVFSQAVKDATLCWVQASHYINLYAPTKKASA